MIPHHDSPGIIGAQLLETGIGNAADRVDIVPERILCPVLVEEVTAVCRNFHPPRIPEDQRDLDGDRLVRQQARVIRVVGPVADVASKFMTVRVHGIPIRVRTLWLSSVRVPEERIDRFGAIIRERQKFVRHRPEVLAVDGRVADEEQVAQVGRRGRGHGERVRAQQAALFQLPVPDAGQRIHRTPPGALVRMPNWVQAQVIFRMNQRVRAMAASEVGGGEKQSCACRQSPGAAAWIILSFGEPNGALAPHLEPIALRRAPQSAGAWWCYPLGRNEGLITRSVMPTV